MLEIHNSVKKLSKLILINRSPINQKNILSISPQFFSASTSWASSVTGLPPRHTFAIAEVGDNMGLFQAVGGEAVELSDTINPKLVPPPHHVNRIDV